MHHFCGTFSCVFRNGLISISDWVFGNVWSCSTLFIMKTSHKSDELNNFKKEGSTNRVPMLMSVYADPPNDVIFVLGQFWKCVLIDEKRIFGDCVMFIHICRVIGYPIIRLGKAAIPFAGGTPPQLSARCLCVSISVLSQDVKLSRWRCIPISPLNSAVFVCLSLARNWISNAIYIGLVLCSMIWSEKWLLVLLVSAECCWPSLFKRSYLTCLLWSNINVIYRGGSRISS